MKKDVDYNEYETTIACVCINRNTDCQHPWADEHTLEYFDPLYVKKCLEKGRRELKLNKLGVGIIDGMLAKLAKL